MVDHRFAKSVLFVHSSLDDAGLTANEFRVYCHLARRAGSSGDAFPSVQTVADVCRMNRDTVWAVLKSLTARGMLQRVPRSGLSTVYVLTTPEHWHPAETEGHPSDPPSGNEGVGGSGNEGVGGSGNEGALRGSTEVTPPKSIQKHPPKPPHADDVPAAPNRLTFDVDSIIWDEKTNQSSRDPRETLASPRETLDQEHGAGSMEHGAGSMEIQPPVVPRRKKQAPQYPTEQEVLDHCKAKHPDWHESGVIDLYRHYVATDWTDKDGKPIKNWKNKFSVIYGFKKEKGNIGPTEEFTRKSRESQNSNPEHRMYMKMKVERDYAE